jgi:hypothetical protein
MNDDGIEDETQSTALPTLFVTDRELVRRLGVGINAARKAISRQQGSATYSRGEMLDKFSKYAPAISPLTVAAPIRNSIVHISRAVWPTPHPNRPCVPRD